MASPKKVARIELHYFPCIAYLSVFSRFDVVELEYYESFQKQTYRNRCRILTSSGVQTLTVPVKKANSSLPIQSIEIDYKQDWQRQHWRAIQSAYGKSPFFEYYSQLIEEIIFTRHSKLIQLNRGILTLCLRLLTHEVTIIETKAYTKNSDHYFSDFRSHFNAKNEVLPTFFKAKEYIQVFGSKFAPNLSVLDLFFCEGPMSMEIIKASISQQFEL